MVTMMMAIVATTTRVTMMAVVAFTMLVPVLSVHHGGTLSL